MNSHADPNHPRFCSPQTFRSFYSFRRNRPARTTRKQSLSFAPPAIPRKILGLKHAATVARKNAFLDLNAAEARLKRGKPEDMDMWMNRYRIALMHERMLFQNFGRRQK